MKQLQVQAIEHTDVRGKKLHYVRLVGENGELLINVGQKTYNGVNHLTKDNKELPTKNIRV